MKISAKNKGYKDRTKKEILKSIKKGAEEAFAFLRGEIKLQDAKYLFKK